MSLMRAGERGHISFDAGRIVNAVMGSAQGGDAVYRLRTWDDGDFDLERLHGTSGFAAHTLQEAIDGSGEDELRALADSAKRYRHGMLELAGAP